MGVVRDLVGEQSSCEQLFTVTEIRRRIRVVVTKELLGAGAGLGKDPLMPSPEKESEQSRLRRQGGIIHDQICRAHSWLKRKTPRPEDCCISISCALLLTLARSQPMTITLSSTPSPPSATCRASIRSVFPVKARPLSVYPGSKIKSGVLVQSRLPCSSRKYFRRKSDASHFAPS